MDSKLQSQASSIGPAQASATSCEMPVSMCEMVANATAELELAGEIISAMESAAIRQRRSLAHDAVQCLDTAQSILQDLRANVASTVPHLGAIDR